jgi:transposase, IS5 family
MDRNYLKGREGDRINVVLAAGYNFSLHLRWPAAILRALILALAHIGPADAG